MVKIVDLGLDLYTYLYVGTQANSKILSYSGEHIPKLQLLSKVDEVLHFDFHPTLSLDGENRGFSLLFLDADGQGKLDILCSAVMLMLQVRIV